MRGFAATGGRRGRDSEDSDSSSSSSSDTDKDKDKASRRRRRKRHRRSSPSGAKGKGSKEAPDQIVQIPPEADLAFVHRMLSAGSSTFVLQLHQQTHVRVSLGNSNGLRRPVIVLSGNGDSAFADCRSRLEELLHVNPERQQKFIRQYCDVVAEAKASSSPGQAAMAPVIVPRSTESESNKVVDVPPDLVRDLMTAMNRKTLMEVTGSDPEWMPDERKVRLRGSADQVNLGHRALMRVVTHCLWGVSEAKILRLLKPGHVEAMLVRLSPMGVSLAGAEKVLSTSRFTMSIGKDRSNDVVVPDPLVSRQHCILELDMDRGAVYVINLSTNGTFLNGKCLPQKAQGKVLLSHGDELLLKDPAQDSEFGYMVNLVDHTVHMWQHVSEGVDIDRELGERLRRREKIGCGN